MRNPLNRSLWREFKQNLGRYSAIIIIMIIMISVVSGFLSGAYSSKDALIKDQKDNNIENGQFAVTQVLNKDVKKKIEDLDLTLYENFYSQQDESDDTKVRVYKNRDEVNIASLHEGRLANKENEIALDRLFAEKNGYKIGKTIKLDNKNLKVVGIISLPDYSSLMEKNSDLMMDAIHFGVALVNEDTFNELSKHNITYNYSYVLDNKDVTEKQNYDKLSDIKDICIQNGYILTNMMTDKMNQCISFVIEDMGGDIPMIEVLLYIILIILAFIFVVISETIIEEQSTVIGTLLASGYTREELVRHYMALPVIITVLSSIIGNIIGYKVLPDVFKGIYYGIYCLPPLEVEFVLSAFISTTVVPLIFMILINYIMLNRKLRLSPIKFLRRDTHKKKSKRHMNLKHGSFMRRFQLRVIIQNKGSYITLFVGIFFASLLLAFGLSVQPTVDNYMKNTEKSVKAEYQYILKAPVELKDSKEAEKLTYTSLQNYFEIGNLDLNVAFYGLEDNSDYYSDVLLPKSKDEITVSYDFAKKIGVKEGNTVTFTNPYTEKEYKFKIVSIYDYKSGFSAYMTRKNLNSILKEENDYYNGYFSNKKLDIDEEYIQTKITKKDVSKIGEQMLQNFNQMIPIVAAVAVVIYIVVMYILTKLVLDRNAKNMSFLKVMGYDNSEIKKLYLNATAIVVVISLIVSVPISDYLIRQVMILAFMRFSGYLEMYMAYYIYVAIFISGLLIYTVVTFILNKNIQRIDLGEALKDTE